MQIEAHDGYEDDLHASRKAQPVAECRIATSSRDIVYPMSMLCMPIDTLAQHQNSLLNFNKFILTYYYQSLIFFVHPCHAGAINLISSIICLLGVRKSLISIQYCLLALRKHPVSHVANSEQCLVKWLNTNVTFQHFFQKFLYRDLKTLKWRFWPIKSSVILR